MQPGQAELFDRFIEGLISDFRVDSQIPGHGTPAQNRLVLGTAVDVHRHFAGAHRLGTHANSDKKKSYHRS